MTRHILAYSLRRHCSERLNQLCPNCYNYNSFFRLKNLRMYLQMKARQQKELVSLDQDTAKAQLSNSRHMCTMAHIWHMLWLTTFAMHLTLQ